MDTLRHGFARCCKILGLDQRSCLALTLLLNSRWEVALMLAWILQEEDKGYRPDTTEVVLMAEKVHLAWMRRKGKEEGHSEEVQNSPLSSGIPKENR